MPDIERWSKLESYSTRWHSRSQIAGVLLKDCRSVLDIGCGNQSLSSYFDGKYIPVDCVPIYPETIILDLDSDFDLSILPKSDGLALIGVLEHTKDPISVINKLSPIANTWAVSYMDKDKNPNYELISLKQLQQAFNDAGFKVADKQGWRNQVVFKLERI